MWGKSKTLLERLQTETWSEGLQAEEYKGGHPSSTFLFLLESGTRIWEVSISDMLKSLLNQVVAARP
jgi:hypothetical protein